MDNALTAWGAGYQDFKPASEIFIVDDDENMRDLLEATLAPEGFPVTSFADGDTFLQVASTRLPICVFLDIVMPRRSGLDVLKELRARQFSTPIFLMSARDDMPTIVEGIKNGAQDYIRKPFDRQAPALRVRDAVQVWSCRDQRKSSLDLQAGEADEWFRLSPGEKEMLSIMRLMGGSCR
ncbi:MAG TPA: response regulator [Xanthobacteraceae bacterium]|jgi:FixJ family two-component response regulator|nr:response regulator [Xanthobacteraceae bacterium]